MNKPCRRRQGERYAACADARAPVVLPSSASADSPYISVRTIPGNFGFRGFFMLTRQKKKQDTAYTVSCSFNIYCQYAVTSGTPTPHEPHPR